MLKPGMTGEKTEIVDKNNAATFYESGALEVYATPAMIALMEVAAVHAVQPLLPEGWSTVGTNVAVAHCAASPLGAKIRAAAKLTEVDGRRLCFTVEAFAGDTKIGEGTHERFIINNERFLEKTYGH
jgi:predicted thioesterase